MCSAAGRERKREKQKLEKARERERETEETLRHSLLLTPCLTVFGVTNHCLDIIMLSPSDVATTPFAGQKPGTSGLRKKVPEFLAPHYMENFLQCTLLAMGEGLQGSTLVVGGDGRYGVKAAVEKIIQMAAANGVSRLVNYQLYFCVITR